MQNAASTTCIRPARRCRLGLKLLITSSINVICLAMPAHAQFIVQSYPSIPERDANGVDIPTAQLQLSSIDLSIGGGLHPLKLERFWQPPDELNMPSPISFAISAIPDANTNDFQIRLFGDVINFTSTANGYVNARGTSETFDGTTYTTANGVKYLFDYWSGNYGNNSQIVRASKITEPDGYSVNVQWNTARQSAGDSPDLDQLFDRVDYVKDSTGYLFRFRYAADDFVNGILPPGYGRLIRATAINTSAQACNDANDYCADVVGSWPTVNYSYTLGDTSGSIALSGPAGTIKNYSWSNSAGDFTLQDGPNVLSGHRFPYDPSQIQKTKFSITNNGATAIYTYTGPYGVAADTAVVTMPGLTDTVYHLTAAHVQSIDVGSNHTQYQRDNNGRIILETMPESNAIQTAYDGRSNVTSVTQIPKPGMGPAIPVFTAGYDPNCTNLATCNQANWTKDAQGNQTDYLYAPSGQIAKITLPAPVVNAPRPETRYSYASIGGVSLPTGSSSCRTSASCTGTADEVTTSIAYSTNLLPTAVSSGAGDGSLTATVGYGYDDIGNRTSVDGPLPGPADTTRYFYDADRQVTGVISPDPDGAGPRRGQALDIHYNATGQIDAQQVGTANADGSGFTSLQTETFGYDGNHRKVSETLSAGGTTYAKVGYGYDQVGRLICTVQRMDPAQWNSQTDNCSPQTTGPNGPDRVEQRGYDAAGRLIVIASAFGTSAASTETMSYTPNGLIATARDANGNLTSYGYDGLDRLTHTVYPIYTPGQNTSNGGDYEQLTYDANGNVTNRRLRDGQSIGYSYDALNRRTHEYNPNTNVAEVDVSYNYDLLGRLTSASDGNGWYNNFEYDALGRVTRQYGLVYGNRMQYDLAGMTTRQTWDDGLFVTYEHDNVGAVTAIRENGGPLLASYVYDDLGRRTSMVRGNGTSTLYSYDGASRLTQLTQDLAGTSNDLTLGFGYNPAGQILSRTSSNDTYSFTASVNVDRGYTTNGLNQYTQSGTVAPVYDARGNLTQSGSQTYQYNTKNQLFRDSANNLIYHNPLGLLGQESGVDLDYVGDHVATEMGNGIARRYVYGPGDEAPILWYEGSGTSDKRYLHDDERGSVIAISDGSGNALAINRYDEFGIPQPGNLGRFQYTGQRWMPGLGMYDYKARVYSPTLGRFMQTDPIGYGDGMNWYNYVGGDPINSIDPAGLCGTPSGPTAADRAQCTDIVITARRMRWSGGAGTGGYGTVIGQDEIDRQRLAAAIRATPARKFLPQNVDPPCLPGVACKPVCNIANNYCGPKPKPVYKKRLFGTHYCGPGGEGPTTGKLDEACRAHDACYGANGLSVGSNFSPFPNAALRECNQNLCDASQGQGTEGFLVRSYFRDAPLLPYNSCRG